MKLPKFTSGVTGQRVTHMTIATALLIVVFLSVSITWAHGIADQVNDPETSLSANCGLGFPPDNTGIYLFQSFTPTAETLAAVDLRLRLFGTLPAEGVTTSIRIRDGSPTGPILGASTAFVPGSTASITPFMAHFDFDPALPTTPGNLYVIEWFALVTDPDNWQFGWMFSETDTYPGGNEWGCTLIDVTWQEFNFITYKEASPPVANDDAASTAHNTPVVINVAANDTDPDADLVLSSVTILSGPANGSAVSNGDGTVTYTPNPGFSGLDTFTYEICDITGLCDDAQVQIDVAPSGSGGDGSPGRPDEPGEVVPDNPSNAADHANENACNNPGSEHRPRNIPPCR
jgi:hypothetical protein